jgi:hypothetical protein
VRVVAFGYTPRQPSSTEVPRRRIGLAVVVTLKLAPLAVALQGME